MPTLVVTVRSSNCSRRGRTLRIGRRAVRPVRRVEVRDGYVLDRFRNNCGLPGLAAASWLVREEGSARTQSVRGGPCGPKSLEHSVQDCRSKTNRSEPLDKGGDSVRRLKPMRCLPLLIRRL
jgi:hypothetical protein